MLKRIFLLLALAACLPQMASAQYGVGDWRIHPFYVGEDISNIIDTGDQVYYLVGNYLYRFDKETLENESVNKRNLLSDAVITGIYYNYSRHYLVVTYLNSNIDIIDRDGNVTNLPEIKDAIFPGEKGINDVTFNAGKILVATQFGLVVYDDTKMTVVESRVFNTDIQSVVEVGEWRIIAYGPGNSVYLYAAPSGAHNESIAQYLRASGSFNAGVRMRAVDDSHIFFTNTSASYLGTLNVRSQQLSISSQQLVASHAYNFQPTKTGYLFSTLTTDGGVCYTLDAAGGNLAQAYTTHDLYSCNPDGDGTVWALGADGLHKAGDNVNVYKPDGINIKSDPFWMAYSAGTNTLMLTNTSGTRLVELGYNNTSEFASYDGNSWTSIKLDGMPNNGQGSVWDIVVDPLDPHTFVFSSRKSGTIKITDGVIVANYNSGNCPYVNYRGVPRFDSQGNLWVVYGIANSASAKNVMCLPRAKYEAATVTKSDWVTPSVTGTQQAFMNQSCFAIGRSDAMVFNSGGYRTAFAFWQPNGGLGTVRTANFTSLMDQDEKSITWDYVYAMTPDKNGLIWVGMDNGVIAFDPTQAFDSNFRINHIKVPRNDGTDLADYLLDGIQVNCIAVDGANRKWIGTNGSGLFLVSADGSKILKQFTTENSYLTTNTIYNVCCNTNSNSVYVVTPTEFLEYFSDTTPGSSDYSNVYVYPNPVRPDFTGLVTINGLMDNSLVKIADASGNVIKQLRSSGGMATWDACDQNGERVKTGVYYVLASQSENGSSGTVAKFLVVK